MSLYGTSFFSNSSFEDMTFLLTAPESSVPAFSFFEPETAPTIIKMISSTTPAAAPMSIDLSCMSFRLREESDGIISFLSFKKYQ